MASKPRSITSQVAKVIPSTPSSKPHLVAGPPQIQEANALELTSFNDASALSAGTDAAASDELVMTRDTVFKLTSCCISFFCAGVDGGSVGTLLPYITRYYGISLGNFTVVYAASFAGWCLAGAANGVMMQYFNFGLILVVGAFIQLLAQTLRFWSPPFGLYCFGFFLTALGTGFQDSHSNNFVSTIKGAYRWLGLIHAVYSIGMLIAPFAANGISSANPNKWGYFYLLPMGLDAMNLVLVTLAFRDTLWKKQIPRSMETANVEVTQEGSQFVKAMRDSWAAIKLRGVWQLSLWFFFYAAAATTSNGWLVEFFVTVRHGNLAQLGYVPSAAYGGGILGRLFLPEITHRFGERRMILIYSLLWIVGQLTVWLVPNIPANVTAVIIMGILAGPFFSTAMYIGSQLFPKSHKPAALSFIFIANQAGGALFPTLTGLIADRAGVKVLQPIVIALMLCAAATWLIIPRVVRRTE